MTGDIGSATGVFGLRQEDVMKMLACMVHTGAGNVDFQMLQYVYKRKADGVHIINVAKTWEKLILAARAIAAIENPEDVCVISARQYGQRAVLKFAHHCGATSIVGRFTPGTFTNQIQKKTFREPRLLVVTDPRTDHQAITEASYVNIPIIALANTDSPLPYVDIAIPCNNKGARSIGLIWWLLAREVLTIKGRINRTTGFLLEGKEIMPDLYFYRDPEDIEKEEAQALAAEPQDDKAQWGGEAPAAGFGAAPAPVPHPEWEGGKESGLGGMGGDAILQVPNITNWAEETQQWTAGQSVQPDTNMAQWGGGQTDWN